MRNTKQRQIILDILKSARNHPTADQIYEKVREHLPKVSLGTVYRNLDLLSSVGEIRKIAMSGQQMRYDGDLTDHVHFRCKHCGNLLDIHQNPDFRDLINSIETPHSIEGFHLELSGICKNCNKLS